MTGQNSVERILASLGPVGSGHDSLCLVGDSLMKQYYDLFRYEAYRKGMQVSNSSYQMLYFEGDPHPNSYWGCLYQYLQSNISHHNIKYFKEFMVFQADLELVSRKGNCGIVVANIGSHYSNNCVTSAGRRGCAHATQNGEIDSRSPGSL